MSLPSITYPFDPTGILPSNLVTNDQHIVTENNYKDFYFVVPKFGPFFIESMIITYATDGVTRTLVEGVDYYGCLPFIGASRSIGKQVYGGISFSDLTLIGAVALKYQTLGGEYLFDDQIVLENIANRVYNPRIVTWEEVTDRPTLFPPTTHIWNLVDQVGQSAVVDALIRIEQAILSRVLDPFSLHITRFDNPHNTNKTQIGLDLVENFPPASLTEAKALTATNRLITPATLKAVLLGYSSLKISALPGNLITLQPDGIYYGNVAAPTPAPAPTPPPPSTPAPTPAPTVAPTPAPSYSESVSMSTSGDAGVGVPITIVNGNPNTNVTITDSSSSTVRSVTLDANGYYSNSSNVFVQAGVQTADNISLVVTFTFGGTQHVITKPFISTRPASEYVETVFMPDGAVQGSSVHISIDGGKPNTNVTVTDSSSSTVRTVALDANGHYATDVVFVQASTQSAATVVINVTFTFNANGHVITKPFTSTFS